MIMIGTVNKLVVVRKSKSGYFLKDKDSEDEVLLPSHTISEKINIDNEVEVFVYLDTKNRYVASGQLPYALVGEYALLRAIDIKEFGAFFDWGIDKDLLVPGNEQKIKVKRFEEHIVRVCIEKDTNRIYGTTKLGKYIQESDFDVIVGEKVKIRPVVKTDLGYRSIINNKFIGMIYHNEIFQELYIDENHEGIVKKLRDDGLIDASLQVQGVKNLFDAKEKILEMLQTNEEGKSHLNDSSSPDEIKSSLGMSKKTFKNAIGMLYKERKIIITKQGIELVTSN